MGSIDHKEVIVEEMEDGRVRLSRYFYDLEYPEDIYYLDDIEKRNLRDLRAKFAEMHALKASTAKGTVYHAERKVELAQRCRDGKKLRPHIWRMYDRRLKIAEEELRKLTARPAASIDSTKKPTRKGQKDILPTPQRPARKEAQPKTKPSIKRRGAPKRVRMGIGDKIARFIANIIRAIKGER